MPKRRFTDEQELDLCRRYAEGENMEQLGRVFGVPGSTVLRALKRNGAKTRPRGEKSAEICRRYLAGESQAQIAKSMEVSRQSVSKTLARHGVRCRFGIRDKHEQSNICSRYLAGESVTQLAKAYAKHSSTIHRIIVRHGIETRGGKGFCDTVQQALDCVGHFSKTRECFFYVFELSDHGATHCKPGIAFEIDDRVKGGNGRYGAEALRLVFGTRQEAFFLEQAVLGATKAWAYCPADLIDWPGASEIRAMTAENMASIAVRLADEMEVMGAWRFAASRVPMTAAQQAACQQRAVTDQLVSTASTRLD
jgi:hypothetical protein